MWTRSRTATVVLGCAIVMLLAGSLGEAFMQNRNLATVLLRNGNRLTGEFETIDNDLLYLRLSVPDERRIPIGRVVVIDFDGGANNFPNAEANATATGDHVLVLRNGNRWRGRLAEVIREGDGSRTLPDARVWIKFDRNNGRSPRVPLRNVRRLYLASVR